MKTLFLHALLTATFLVVAVASSIPGVFSGYDGAGEKGVWSIQYRLTGDRVSYAVINGPSKSQPLKGAVDYGGSSNGTVFARLIKPDGTTLDILDTGRIFQLTDGRLTEFSDRVTAKEFKAFLDSLTTEPSLSALRAFLRESRKTQ